MTSDSTSQTDKSDILFAIRSVKAVPYWINSVSKYKDASVTLLSDIDGRGIMLADAMEANRIGYLNFSPIGRVDKVVSDWLYEDQPLVPLTKKEIARSD